MPHPTNRSATLNSARPDRAASGACQPERLLPLEYLHPTVLTLLVRTTFRGLQRLTVRRNLVPAPLDLLATLEKRQVQRVTLALCHLDGVRVRISGHRARSAIKTHCVFNL